MAKKPNSDGRIIQSVERAINALLLFLDNDKELAIKEFAELLSLPKPTIHSIVNTLVVHQILEQNPENRKYHLGPVLFRLGLQYIRQQDILSALVVWMERLCYKYKKSVNVCMLVSGKVVVVYKVDPEEAILSYPHVGATVPIHNTANGKVLMAFAAPGVREKILAGLRFAKATEYTITDQKHFVSELDAVRKSGIGFNREEGIVGVSSISGPIYNHNSRVIASFAISGDAGWFAKNESQIIGDVKLTANSVSKQIGYTGIPFS